MIKFDTKLVCINEYSEDKEQYGVDFIVGNIYTIQDITDDGYYYVETEDGSDILMSLEEVENNFKILN